MTTEQIILSHSHRGMDILKDYLPLDFVRRTAVKLERLPRGNVLIATGFYVSGHAETDGPAGAFALSAALSSAGFTPVIITDRFCDGFFSGTGYEILTCDDTLSPEDTLSFYDPSALISVERCGINAQGIYANMKGDDISGFTPPVDKLFAAAMDSGIYTVGIGDGGNEIGMGNLKDVIAEKLPVTPCIIRTADLIIADVSNWGAYALCAELGSLSGKKLLPDYQKIITFIRHTVSLGSVDGVTKLNTATEDGYPPEVSKEIYNRLSEVRSNGTD